MSNRQHPCHALLRWPVFAMAVTLLLASHGAAAEPAPVLPIDEQRAAAYELQQQQQWCEARQAWADLLEELTEDEAQRIHRQEAQQNLRLLGPLCSPSQQPTQGIAVPLAETPPGRVPEADLLRYYPAGKHVRSMMLLNITGRGENHDWIFHGEAHFAYQHRVALESKVLSNNGTRLTVEMLFGEIAQVQAVSGQTLELRMPEDPIVLIVWQQLEDLVLRPIPAYAVIRKAADLASILDPRLKRTLTFVQEQLRQMGLPVPDAADIELAAQLDRLSGARLEIEYISGVGITHIKVLDGEQFDPADLLRLAYNLSMLVDYHIFPGLSSQPGERWEVQAQDVAGLMNVNHYGKTRGALTLERSGDRTAPDGETQAVLRLVDGEVRFAGELPREIGGARGLNATFTPRAGLIYYSPTDWLIREARIAWNVSHVRFSTDHLLFGTRRIRNLKIESYYEAQRVDQAEDAEE